MPEPLARDQKFWAALIAEEQERAERLSKRRSLFIIAALSCMAWIWIWLILSRLVFGD